MEVIEWYLRLVDLGLPSKSSWWESTFRSLRWEIESLYGGDQFGGGGHKEVEEEIRG